MCWGEACGAGVGSGDHPALPEPGLPASRRRFTEYCEWNEWGVQTLAEIRRGGEGPSPWPDGQHPLLPKGTWGIWPGSAAPPLSPSLLGVLDPNIAKDRAAGWVAVPALGSPDPAQVSKVPVAHAGRLVRFINW